MIELNCIPFFFQIEQQLKKLLQRKKTTDMSERGYNQLYTSFERNVVL